MSNVYTKVNELRKAFHSVERKKTGYNAHSKFQFFELQDFIADVMKLCEQLKVCIFVSEITPNVAVIKAVDTENPDSSMFVEICSAIAQIPKATDIQNVGGTITYMRRYAWTTFLEIVENDAVDASEQPAPQKKPNGLSESEIAINEEFGKQCIAWAGYDSTTPEDIVALREQITMRKDTPMFGVLAKTMKDIFTQYGWSFNENLHHRWERKDQTKTKTLINNSDNPFGGFEG